VLTSNVQTISNKSLKDSDNYIINGLDPSRKIQFDASSVDANSTTVYSASNESGTLVTEQGTQYITNKTFGDTNNFIYNTAVPTKLATFACNQIQPNTTRTFSFPNSDGRLVLDDNMTTLTNKTVDVLRFYEQATTFATVLSPNAFTGDYTLNLPSIITDDTLVSETLAQNLTNKRVDDATFKIYDSVDTTRTAEFQCGQITSGFNRKFTFPDWSGSIVLNDNTTSMQNKTLQASTTTIYDDGDPTRLAKFDCTNIATETTRTYSFPDASGIISLKSDIVTGRYCQLFSNILGVATAINNSTYTQLLFGASVSFLTDGSFMLTGTSGEVKCLVAGTYRLTYELGLKSSVANNEMTNKIYINGNPSAICHLSGTDGVGASESDTMNQIVTLAINDILSVWALDNSATSNVTTTNSVFILQGF